MINANGKFIVRIALVLIKLIKLVY